MTPTAQQQDITHRSDTMTGRAELRARFAGMLGWRDDVPAEQWRAVGDLEVLRQQVTNTLSWLTSLAYGLTADREPQVPHRWDDDVKAMVPAEGTRIVHDAVVAAAQAGIDLSAIKTEWDNAYRDVTARTQGAPGFKGVK